MSDYYYTSAATSRALRDAGLPQDADVNGAVWLLEGAPFLSRGASPQLVPPRVGELYQWARAWRLDELLAELDTPRDFVLRHWDDPCSNVDGPHWEAANSDFTLCHVSPVEAVAALLLAIRGTA